MLPIKSVDKTQVGPNVTKEKENRLAELLGDVQALKTAMETSINGATPDHAKWISFKSCASMHGQLVQQYAEITGETLSYYDVTKMKSSMDTLWPVQKEIFEGVYLHLTVLHGRLSKRTPAHIEVSFQHLMHPVISAAAIKHFTGGDFRNASLDAVIALFDMLRSKSGLQIDGDNLCNQAFSLSNPVLVLSEIDTESGRNDQRGFLDIFKGFYRGVRNPKAHSLTHDLDGVKSAQHLVLASMLARRVDEAHLVNQPTVGGRIYDARVKTEDYDEDA